MATIKKGSDASQTVPDSVCELWRKGAALSWPVEELSKEATERECSLVSLGKVTSETYVCVFCSVKVAGVICASVQTGNNPMLASASYVACLKRHTIGFSLHIFGFWAWVCGFKI